MNKTYLVALREYVENLRTKAFWIGILAFPLIIVASIFIGRLMDSAKDVRDYAVLDHSAGEWLSREVELRIQIRDIGKILGDIEADTAEEIRARIAERTAEHPEDHPARKIGDLFGALPDEQLLQVVAGFQQASNMVQLVGADELVAQLQSMHQSWAMDKRAQKQMLALFDGLSFKDSRLVKFDDLGAEPEKKLKEKLENGRIFAYFVIGEDPVAGSEGCNYVSNNVTDNDLKNAYGRVASEIVQERRVAKLKEEKNLTDDEARLLNAPLSFSAQKIDEATGEAAAVTKEEKAGQFAPVAFVYLLWISVFTAAQMLLTNTIEEKSNRILEVLLSSVSPLQLMAGKVFGIAATGLTVVGSWVLCALIGVKLMPVFIPNMDIDLAGIVGDPLYLSSFVVYFLAGYFFFAALLVGIGSVCNSLKEAQNLQQPVVLLLIVPLIAMIPVVNDPNGTLARVLTYIPPFTPFLMMNRAGGPPPTWEYVATSILLVVSIGIAFWGAAKIFRIGILMTGKPPKIREILGWLRAPIGTVHVKQDEHGDHHGPGGSGLGLGIAGDAAVITGEIAGEIAGEITDKSP